jgi:hypothetical protein
MSSHARKTFFYQSVESIRGTEIEETVTDCMLPSAAQDFPPAPMV